MQQHVQFSTGIGIITWILFSDASWLATRSLDHNVEDDAAACTAFYREWDHNVDLVFALFLAGCQEFGS